MTIPGNSDQGRTQAASTDSTASIVVENLGKRFRQSTDRPSTLKEALVRRAFTRPAAEWFWGLTGVSFSVARGSMLGVIGHNGAGKSTLLRLIGGVGRSDEGRVVTHGRIGALLELGAGFHPDLTGRENALLLAVIAGLTRKEAQSRFDEVVAFAELEAFIDAPLRTYSSGMTLRLAFAVAAHTDPDVLLIDEVLAVGDLAFQRKCIAHIQKIKRAGAAIVLVTHDMDQLNRHCDLALWLRRGKVAGLGHAQAIVAEYTSELARATQSATPHGVPDKPTPQGRMLKAGVNRFGSFELEITRVWLRNGSGAVTNAIGSGEPLIVDLELVSSNAVLSPIVCISIRNESNQLCLDTNTEADRFELGTIRGTHRVRLSLARLDLAGGSYVVNVGAYERRWAHAYDEHSGVYQLTVHPTPEARGLIAPPLHWELDVHDSKVHSHERRHENGVETHEPS